MYVDGGQQSRVTSIHHCLLPAVQAALLCILDEVGSQAFSQTFVCVGQSTQLAQNGAPEHLGSPRHCSSCTQGLLTCTAAIRWGHACTVAVTCLELSVGCRVQVIPEGAPQLAGNAGQANTQECVCQRQPAISAPKSLHHRRLPVFG